MKRKGVFKILSIIGVVLFATLIGVAIDIKSLALLCGSAAALVMMLIFRIEVWAEE